MGLSFTYFDEESFYDERNLTVEQFNRDPFSKTQINPDRRFNNINVHYMKGDITHDFQVTDKLSFSSKLFTTNLDRPRFRIAEDEIGLDPSKAAGVSGLDPDDAVMEARDRNYRTIGAETRVEYAGF
mgnify:CR=1 FL=1